MLNTGKRGGKFPVKKGGGVRRTKERITRRATLMPDVAHCSKTAKSLALGKGSVERFSGGGSPTVFFIK